MVKTILSAGIKADNFDALIRLKVIKMANPKIGFIGTGELALYTIRGFRQGGFEDRINLSPRNQKISSLLAQNYHCDVMESNQAVADASDYVFIATRPPHCLSTLADLTLSDRQTLVSVVAGISIKELKTVLNVDIPVIRVMPVSSAEAGASPTLIHPADAFASVLFDYCGTAITTPREETFEQGSVLACVYSWFFELYNELIDATQSADLPPELAAKLVMGMASGAAQLALSKPDQTPGEIAEGIATEGTFSKMGLDLLKERDNFSAWKDAAEMLKQKLA